MMLVCFGVAVRADVGVVLADPTSIGASVFTHAGHSLVYLSGVCAESPVKARLCEEGEEGSVVTTYPDFREREAYAWNLVPLGLYLRGSLIPGDRLLYGSRLVKTALEEHARAGYLREVCPEGFCPEAAHSFWRDIVGATVSRDVFIFAVHTTREQDEAAVTWLNTRPNVNHYNGITNNCAVFTSSLVNLYFPHSVHRDFPNDLGMMAPKAATRSFTHWALKRPELGFYSMHFAQQPGDMPRSAVAQSGTETAIHMKKYLIAAALIGDHEVAGSFFVSYFLTGRFGVYKEYARHPSSSIVELEVNEKVAKENEDKEDLGSLQEAVRDERAEAVGVREVWDGYKARFAEMQTLPEVRELTGHKRLFPEDYDKATAKVDAEGNAWMAVERGGLQRRVGVSRGSLLLAGSDAELAFQLMLGRVAYALHAKNHLRETMPEFRDDWMLMEQTHERLLNTSAEQIRLASATR